MLTSGLTDIETIQVGNYVLDGANTTADPDASQVAAVRGYLTNGDRPSAAPLTTISLALAIPKVCDPRTATFKGKLKIDGSSTFGAQIQRQIGGAFSAQLNPANHDRWSMTPVLQLTTSYGDQIKASTTTKSSQVDTGRIDLQVRLNTPSSSTTLGNTDLHVIADEYHSFSQGIALQQGYGVGISQVTKGLVLQGDIWYIHEKHFDPSPSFASGAGRLYESYTFFPTKRFTLTEDCETVLPFKSLNSLFVRGATELVMKLGNLGTAPPFSLTLTYSDYYFRNAPRPYRQSYSKATLGIVYAW